MVCGARPRLKRLQKSILPISLPRLNGLWGSSEIETRLRPCKPDTSQHRLNGLWGSSEIETSHILRGLHINFTRLNGLWGSSEIETLLQSPRTFVGYEWLKDLLNPCGMETQSDQEKRVEDKWPGVPVRNETPPGP